MIDKTENESLSNFLSNNVNENEIESVSEERIVTKNNFFLQQ